ncbi:MAG: hypothetical protein WBF58_01290 [Xanthobacteraceae bacterium]
MARLLVTRILGAVALCSVALLLVGLAPLPAPVGPAVGLGVGAGVSAHAPTVTVNRFRKGDRLPLFTAGRDGTPQGLESRRRVPVGCDPAFSPVSTPALSTLYGRCTV